MARKTVSKHNARRTATPKLKSNSKFSRAGVFVAIGGLAIVGLIAVLSSFASTSSFNAVLAIGDINGGFANSFVVINPDNGAVVRSVQLPDLPDLAGCSAAQPKPYLYDFVLDPARKVGYASLKACSGGVLPAGRAVARFNLATGQFSGYLDGLADGATLSLHPQTGSVMAVSGSGTQLWFYDIASSTIRQKLDFAGRSITRIGVLPGNNNVAIAFADGQITSVDVVTGGRQDILKANVAFPRVPGVDGSRAVYSMDAFWLLGEVNGAPKLVSVTTAGTVATYPLGSTGASLALTSDAANLIIATGCPTGLNCTASPNRLYLFNISSRTFTRLGQSDYVALQTSPSRVREDSASQTILFDGVVTGSAGASQRFMFAMQRSTAQLSSARVALPTSVWEPVLLDAQLLNTGSSAPAASVSPGVPSGGGVGGGTIATAPVPIDEIERQLGMSIYDIDWTKISDTQIRAYGYDPQAVRAQIARLKAARAQGGGSVSAEAVSCRLGSSSEAAQVAAIERLIGTSLVSFDFSQVTDAQIQSYGYDPVQVRRAVTEYQRKAKSTSGNDPCGNSYTQSSYVVGQGSSQAGTPGGTVTNVTATTQLDLASGGWVVLLRWQAPGGATKFHIYGRDEKKHPNEKHLAVVDGLTRSVKFGGFGTVALAPWQNERYTLAVVPEQADGTTGGPTAIQIEVSCFIVYCQAGTPK